MQKRLVTGALLSVAMVGLAGCPPTQGLEDGTWLFSILSAQGTDFLLALDLLDGGYTRDPDPRPPDTRIFSGNLRWMQNESTFTMTHVGDGFTAVYTGIIDSGISIDGTWTITDASGDQRTSTWAAEKL